VGNTFDASQQPASSETSKDTTVIILAIDPGISGALAFYQHTQPGQSGLLTVYDMPLLDGDVSPHQLRAIIRSEWPDIAIIEHVHPPQGRR
jgi:hypothetical protein